jgi:hypothetical protein
MTATVTPVADKRDLDAFIRLPWSLYRGDPNWVPPLLMMEREEFSPQKNPFYQHADVQLFLARRNGDVVGRLSAHIDHEYNTYHDERTGCFGFFESERDPSTTASLLTAAEEWLLARGMDRVRGPLSFSTNGISGLLIDGFDSPPMVMMPYSPDHYPGLIEAAGFTKTKDLYAWRYNWSYISQGAARMANKLRQAPEVTVRIAEVKRFKEEVRNILDVFNDAWSNNWGFVPATDAEADKLAHDIRPIVDPHLVPIVEVDGKMAAFVITIPNLNEAIHDLNGHLFPFGFLKLLWRTKVRRLRTGRLILMGVRKEYRTRRYAGLAYLVLDELYHQAIARGYEWAEFSWTLEDNGLINSVIHKLGCDRYKTYRIYEKALTP